MVLIDVIKILESCDWYSVIVTRLDTKLIRSRASLVGSRALARKCVEDKTSIFRTVGRSVKVRWQKDDDTD